MISKVKLITDFSTKDNITLHNTKDILKFLHDFENLDFLAEEHTFAIFTDTTHKIINYCLVAKGNERTSLLDFKTVFKVALLSNASCIVLAHNHPSACLKPSKRDLKTTRYLKFGCKILGFELLDNVIVANNDVFSLYKMYGKSFDKKMRR